MHYKMQIQKKSAHSWLPVFGHRCTDYLLDIESYEQCSNINTLSLALR